MKMIKAKIGKRIGAIALVLSMVLGMIPAVPVAAEGTETTVTSWSDLKTEIDKGGTQTITISGEITPNSYITIPDGSDITIQGGTITGSTYSYYITVGESAGSATLTLQDITISNNSINDHSLIYVAYGVANIENGVVVKDNTIKDRSLILTLESGTLNVNGGIFSDNKSEYSQTYGSVVIYNQGTCTVNGGVFQNNTSTGATKGAAIYNTSTGTLNLYGGTFDSGNTTVVNECGIFHSSQVSAASILRIKGNPMLNCPILLDTKNDSKYVLVSGDLTGSVILKPNEYSEGYVLAKADTGYTLTESDFSKIFLVQPSDGTTWYTALSTDGTSIVATEDYGKRLETVYLDTEKGSATGDGTKEDPVDSLEAAKELLQIGGTIVIDDYSVVKDGEIWDLPTGTFGTDAKVELGTDVVLEVEEGGQLNFDQGVFDDSQGVVIGYESPDRTTPVVTAPTASSIASGDTLSKSTLSGGSAVVSAEDSTTVDGKFVWVNSDEKVTNTSGTTYKAVFVPTYKETYNTKVVEVSVPLLTEVTNTGTNDSVNYDGKTYDVSTMFTKDVNAGDATYTVVADGTTGAGTLSGSVLTITKAGAIVIQMDTAASGNYAAGATTATLTVAKGTQTAPAISVGSAYNSADDNYTITITAVTGAEYSFDNATWSSTNTKTVGTDKTAVTGYIRLAATDVLNASASATASATTGTDIADAAAAAEAAKALAEVKVAAIKELKDSVDLDDYRDAEKAAVETALEEAETAINAATTTDAVKTAKDAAATVIDAIKTDEELTQEEADAAAAKALADAKAAAIKELKDSVDLDDYRADEQAEIETALEDAEKAINGATTTDAVKTAKDAATTKIADIKTDAELTKEEEEAAAKTLAQAKQDAIKELEDSVTLEDYRDAEQAEVEATLNAGKDKINAATTTDGVVEAKEKVRKEIVEIKTDAQLKVEEAEALEEAKAVAIKELEESVDLDDYRDAEKVEVKKTLEEAKAAINAATTTDDVVKAKEEVRQEIADIKTDDKLKAEEDAKALEEAKAAAIKELEEAVDLDDYRDAEKAEVEKALEEAKATISAATTTDDVVKAKEEVSKEIAKVQTDAELTEKEELQEFDITGTVTDDQQQVVKMATVELRIGNQVIATFVTEADGEFIFTGLKPGIYNIVTCYNGQTVTDVIIIEDSDVKKTVQLPSKNINSVVNIKDKEDDKIQIVVGGLNEEAQSLAKNPEDTVTVEMSIQKVTSIDTDEVNAIEKVASEEYSSDMKFEHYDFTVLKTINGNDPEKVSETSNVLELVLTFDTTDKKDIVVYRCHEGKVEALIELETMPEGNYQDGTFYVDKENGLIYIYVQKFSTYTVGYVEMKVEEPGGVEGTETPDSSEIPDVSETPDTGDESMSMLFTYFMLLGLCGAAFVTYERKYER